MIGLFATPLMAADRASATRPASEDWPMWGRTPDRNMVSPSRGLPAEWDVKTDKNIKWKADLGTQTFGNPVVGGGKVLIGTNNGKPRDPEIKGDKGVLMCFAEADGRFLWQAVHDKLPAGDPQDWSDIGITSTPCIVDERVYYVSNRGELVCADLEGFRDGENDGPFKDEARRGDTDVDVIWSLDMPARLGVVPLFASASPPLVVGDLVFVVTGNGQDDEEEKVIHADAPSFIAVRCDTGEVTWADVSPGERIISGQWSGAAYGVAGGEPQVVFPGGDGWLYAFKPASGELLWKFNCKAHEPQAGDKHEQSKDQLLATPLIHGDRVYIAVGQDPEQGDGEGCLRAIDATKRGDITASAEVWKLAGKDFGRSVSTVVIRGDLLFAAELGGYLNCIEAASGKRHWRADVKASIWGSPVVADGKVYLANQDGDVAVFEADRVEKPPTISRLGGTTHGTAAVANGVLFVADRSRLYAIATR